MPEFSICIPAYKSRFLRECIQSVLRQTTTGFELIILNDCSPEPVKEIVQEFHDIRIRYYENEENTGALRLTDNWNRCLRLATGNYLIIMGDDDRLQPDYLEEFSRLIGGYPGLDVYHCRSTIINDAGEPLQLTPSHPEFEHVCDHIWHRLRQFRSQYISDFVYRSDSLRQRGGFYHLPLAWGSDDITAFMAMATKGIAHTQKPVFEYRSNALSITSTGSDLEKMRANLAYGRWLQEFLEQHRPHPDEVITCRQLKRTLPDLLRARNLHTLSVSLRNGSIKKAFLWYRYRRELGIPARDIAIALLKSRNITT